MTCKICKAESILLFSQKILGKYESGFYECTNCGFVHTDTPTWLPEAYQDAISDMDTGILERNIKFGKIVPIVIKSYFRSEAKFIDYGAGYGIFVRMMRDKGFDFWWQDAHCQNLFARKFDNILLPTNDQKFELLTAFEVFEHLENPLLDFEKMLKYSDNILFSTNLIPKNSKLKAQNSNLESWWYLSPETGQHIAFYTKKSLQILGEKYGMNLYTNGHNFHLLTKNKINPYIFTGLKIMKSIQNMIKKEHHGARDDRDTYKNGHKN